jgi:signal transduction histidine kinase
LLVVIATMATIVAVISYQYTSTMADSIANIATEDARSNADIQSRDFANILANKMEVVATNLQIMANTTTIQNQDVQGAIPLFTSAHQSTNDITSTYFWLNKEGKLLWADAFTNKTTQQKYKGEDRSYRPYYSNPKDTLKPYFSTIIESVDGVPRLYVAYPVISQGQNSTAVVGTEPDKTALKGVVVAAINIDALGKFLRTQLSSKYQSNVGLMDRSGLLLYSSLNSTYVGKNIFGPEVQSKIPLQIKDTFNNFIRQSLKSAPGSGDFSYLGNTTTIAYQPVSVKGNEFAILYITTPHTFAKNVNSLIDQQRTFDVILLVVIGIIATGSALVVLTWNKRLHEEVLAKTADLKKSNESLAVSNERFAAINQQLTHANEKLLIANEQLQNNDKMQREFINIAAHELRTPTQAIMGYSELFYMAPEGRDEAMKAIARNAARLERLTNDILDVTRIEGNALSLNKEKFSVREVILTAIEDAKNRLANGDINFIYDGEDVSVYADKARIYQVVSNLINNAIKFTKRGTISITSEKRTNKNGNEEVVVSVKDNGQGIDETILPRLFTKFTSRSQTGTGLGLFISKSIVEAHGGNIEGKNNSKGEKGATFLFSLPLSTIEA